MTQCLSFSNPFRYTAFGMVKNILKICDCGVAEYRKILEFQFELRQQRHEGKIPDTILIVEHLPVITLGARKSANKLLETAQHLKKMNIDVVDIRRGGGVTAHNQGQLVFYPILNIQKLKLGINEYIRELEQIGIELLGQLNVTAERKKGVQGLWTNSRKIASVGVRVSKGITTHGMAMNIKNDLSVFENFVPCGLDGVKITSVKKETSQTHLMAEVKEILSTLLVNHFSRERLVEYEKCSWAPAVAKKTNAFRSQLR